MGKSSKIGKISGVHLTCIDAKYAGLPIMQSDGLIKHIQKRHPDCVKYFNQIQTILAKPDYIGVNPNEKDVSFEAVKVLSENILIGIKIHASGNYFYVATLFKITEAKLRKNVANGRLRKV